MVYLFNLKKVLTLTIKHVMINISKIKKRI
ncbi:hypothetical protein Terranova_069 [Staphylococcus phage Terranova]|nr:hypothetical protein Quidividi_066 [Staphylococcus phage Quidividi]AXF38505.1 hypothetical protein Twillingate_069 [Staphylococcus phage Twillingate]AXY83952.1 hypothetical protein Terranova_069 [Staphylococcus phage Terranova]